MKSNKVFSKSSIILLVIGALFILSGIILPSVIFKGGDEGFVCEINRELDKVEYEVSLYTSKAINTSEVYLIINGKGHKLIFEDSDLNDYEFELTLTDSDNLISSYKTMKLSAQTANGQKLEFEKLGGSGKQITTLLLIALGAVLCLIPLLIWITSFVKQKFGYASKKETSNITEITAETAEKINQDKEIKSGSVCDYCGYIYDKKTSTCDNCGAPIKNK